MGGDARSYSSAPHTAIYLLKKCNQISKYSNKEQLTIHKLPTHGKYLIEDDSIGPPATQKIQ